MAEYLKWDQEGEKYWETGVDKVVLFVQKTDGTYDNGIAWNGVTSIQVQPTGGEANPQYADNIKYLNLFSLEENGATLEAFQFPDDFWPCNGYSPIGTGSKMYASAQDRRPFALAWRTRVGNDTSDQKYYKIHLLYGCKASPSEMQYSTVNESPEAGTMSWPITTTPPTMTDAPEGYRNTSYFVCNSRDYQDTLASQLAWLEGKLYGTAAVTGTNAAEAVLPTLPSVDDLVTHMIPA